LNDENSPEAFSIAFFEIESPIFRVALVTDIQSRVHQRIERENTQLIYFLGTRTLSGFTDNEKIWGRMW